MTSRSAVVGLKRRLALVAGGELEVLCRFVEHEQVHTARWRPRKRT